MINKKYRLVIPAAGRSSRSGLDYPKTLHLVGGIPILVRLCCNFKQYDEYPIIIINPIHEILFRKVLSEHDVNAEIAYQNEPMGMGHALLQAEGLIMDDEDVILVWSDIPLLNTFTIKHLLDCHGVSENDFSFVTGFCDSCYTIVVREKGKIISVIETRSAGIDPGKFGERDIGFFVFKKKPTFFLLKEQKKYVHINGRNEHGFLYIIEKLVLNGGKVEGYPIARENDLLSFNTPEDLRQIEAITGLTAKF
jgi:bifunctional UDP-N-acetylglucosamine pyrophosphorylase/glucosamine-1-phosphate N-acetyltransferase